MNRCVSRPGSSRSSRLPAHFFGLQQATNQRLHAAARSAAERSALPQRTTEAVQGESTGRHYFSFQTDLVKLIVNRSAEHLVYLLLSTATISAVARRAAGRPSLSQPT